MISKVNKYIEVLLGILTAILVALISTEVFLRYVFGKSLIWSNEVSRFLFIWIVFLGASYACYNNSHFCMDMILTKVHGKNRYIMETIIMFFELVIIVVIMINGIYLTQKTMVQTFPALRIPVAYAYLSLPISAFLMFINVIYSFVLKYHAK
jgi:TRAP-type C4-dicarboxylate transport system permease small subunit